MKASAGLLSAAAALVVLDAGLAWAFARAVGDGSGLLTPSAAPDAVLLSLGAASLVARVATRLVVPALLVLAALFAVTPAHRRH